MQYAYDIYLTRLRDIMGFIQLVVTGFNKSLNVSSKDSMRMHFEKHGRDGNVYS